VQDVWMAGATMKRGQVSVWADETYLCRDMWVGMDAMSTRGHMVDEGEPMGGHAGGLWVRQA